MYSLWPIPEPDAPPGPLSDDDLARLYAFPDDPATPWLQANFVSSADGAVTLDDRSEGLSHPADKRVFLLGRELADVVLVGAGTVRAENYRGVRSGAQRRARRRERGLAEVPPIAVVTASADLDPDAALFTDTEMPPIVITTAAAPAVRKRRLTDAGAEVVIAGEDLVDPPAAIEALDARGLRRIDCEGGPRLFGELLAHDLVDQLCLTIAPLLAGAGPGRIAAGTHPSPPREMRVESILHEDGFTLFRYRRAGDG